MPLKQLCKYGNNHGNSKAFDTKVAVRLVDTHRAARGPCSSRIYPFKIKLTLPEQKTVNIKKSSQVIKTVNVRRKSECFSARSARMLQLLKYINFP